jgi:adenylate cyclase
MGPSIAVPQQMKIKRQKIIPICLAGVLVLLMTMDALGTIKLPWMGALNRFVYDTHLALTLPEERPVGVVVLDIDERSLASPSLGRWPWNRAVLSDLMERLFDEYAAKVVAFDVIFAEPDRSSGLAMLRELAKKQLAGSTEFKSILDKIEGDLDYDGRFEEALMSYPMILGYYFAFGDQTQKAGGLPPTPILLPDRGPHQFVQAPGYGGNLEAFEEVAIASGHFSPIVDIDGLVRRVPMFVAHEGGLYQSLSLATVRVVGALDRSQGGALKLPPLVFLDGAGVQVGPADGSTIERVLVDGRAVPLDRDGTLLVPYAGRGKSFKYIPAIDVFEGKVDKAALEGKVVIVGTTAPGLLDLRATPLDGIYPGVEVHANLIASLLEQPGSGQIRHTPHYAEVVLASLTLLLGVLALATTTLTSPAVSGVAVLSILGAVVGAHHVAWRAGEFWPIAQIVSAALAAYFLLTLTDFYQEFKNKRQFTSLFGQYVPPELVEMMAEDPERYSMAGVKKQLTVLFSDVRGFTSISEQLSPADLSEYINEYLSTMSRIIREKGGTLDKYIGDAIMAFWGAPIDDDKHAKRAVLAAIAMIDELQVLKASFAERGWPPLSIGVGLSTGPMSVGDMGSDVRRAYTVMGDAVNLGSRLEGLTRIYGTWMLLPEATVSECDGIIFREIDQVKVKGKDEPIRIYEPIGVEGEVATEAAEELESWSQALAAYRGKDFNGCIAKLNDLTHRHGAKTIYEWLGQQCQRLLVDPPPVDWQAITKFDTK